MHALSRRQFLTTTAATAAALSMVRPGRADIGATRLRVVRRVIEVSGRAANVYGLLQADGTHGLSVDAGQRFHVQLANELQEETLVHWHGLTPPSGQDGVPDLSQPPLKAGASFEYDFHLARPGTNWMHSHLRLQEQQLLAAPLIVRDPAETHLDEQEVVVLLHDFTFRDPAEILAELGRGMEHAQHGGAAPPDQGMAGKDHGAMGHDAGAIGSTQPHLNDVEFDAYLANDRALDDPEVVRVEAGGRVRLRIINGASATNFWLDLGALEGDLVAVDGHAVVPVRGRRFPLAIAQRADIRLQLPSGTGVYPILAVREGDTPRTGIILATRGAAVMRIPDRAKAPAGPVDLAIERRLRGIERVAENAQAVRRHVLELTGGMTPFVWSFAGKRFGEGPPLPVRAGERVEIVLVNRTDMSHPIHLHGHPFQVIGIDDAELLGAVRDTVLVPIGGRVAIAFLADNPGHWALHCHNLYHMAAGMMTSVRYES
jgi:FtsP/CotA-like multicopper oxidase with cupredoxin domain